MQSPDYMEEIRELATNMPTTIGKGKTKKRPSVARDDVTAPNKKPSLDVSPATRARLAALTEQHVNSKKQLNAEVAAVIAESVSNYFFSPSALLDSRLFTANEGEQIAIRCTQE